MICTPPHKSSLLSGPCFGWKYLLLSRYIGSINPLLHVPLSSCRLRPSEPYASIPSLALGCSPLNFLRAPVSSANLAARVCRQQVPTHSFVPLISPSTHLARNTLVPTALDPCISTHLPGLVKGRQLRSYFLSYFLVRRVISILAGSINDKPWQRAVRRSSLCLASRDSYVSFLSLSPYIHRSCRVSLSPQVYSPMDLRPDALSASHHYVLSSALPISLNRALSPLDLSFSEITI